MRRLICAFVVTNHRRQFFSVAVNLLYERLKSKIRNLIFVEYDIRSYNSNRIVICAVSSKHLQCVCRHTMSYPDFFIVTALSYSMIYDSKHGNH